jgi:hypothetical protein
VLQVTADAARWWTPTRIWAAACVALAVGGVAFIYRFNTLGGTLGGLGNDHFAQLMRSEVLLRGEQPLRDFADAELRGAWPALSYAVSAWAQQLWGRSLLSEAYLTVGALAAAYMLVFVLALDFSRRWTVALLAALAAMATFPKLYNYPKVLMPALAVLSIRLMMPQPSAMTIAGAAAVTALASLFRHDYGVFVLAAVIGGLIARDGTDVRRLTRHLAAYLAIVAVLLTPSAAWVQIYQGIPSYIRAALATSRIEVARTELRMPQLDVLHPFAPDGLLVWSYAAFWLVPALGLLIVLLRRSAGPRLTPSERGVVASLITLAFALDFFFLRSNLSQRFGDAAVPVVLLASWIAGIAPTVTAGSARLVTTMLPVALLCAIIALAWGYTAASSEFANGDLSLSWTRTRARSDLVHADLQALPPREWTRDNAEGILVAARYIAECTRPEDRLLVAGYMPEVPVFARRAFAAGQATVSLAMYTSDDDQRRALDRLARQSVPVVLADARDFEEGFVSDYPLLAKYIADRYRQAGTIAIDGEPRLLVFVDRQRQPTGVDAYLGLPCFR